MLTDRHLSVGLNMFCIHIENRLVLFLRSLRRAALKWRFIYFFKGLLLQIYIRILSNSDRSLTFKVWKHFCIWCKDRNPFRLPRLDGNNNNGHCSVDPSKVRRETSSNDASSDQAISSLLLTLSSENITKVNNLEYQHHLLCHIIQTLTPQIDYQAPSVRRLARSYFPLHLPRLALQQRMRECLGDAKQYPHPSVKYVSAPSF